MHTLQGAAVSPHLHDSGTFAHHVSSTPFFAWLHAPVRPGTHPALAALVRAEATAGGQEMLLEAVSQLHESGIFADLLWSFHRAEKKSDLATIEDHLTTLCARMYLAGQFSVEVR